MELFNPLHQFPFLLKVWVAQVAVAAILQAVFFLVEAVEAVAGVDHLGHRPTRYVRSAPELVWFAPPGAGARGEHNPPSPLLPSPGRGSL